MKVVEKTGKTADEAVQAALEELNVPRDQVEVEILTASSKGSLFGLFGGREAKVRVTLRDCQEKTATPAETVTVEKEDVAITLKSDAQESAVKTSEVDTAESEAERQAAVNDAKEFLQTLFKAMGMEVAIEKFFAKEENGTMFKLHGDGLGVLIGKHGQTLDSLQYLTNLVANKHSKERIRIILDAENYRKRRQETLERLAKNLASKVKRNGIKAALEPMNPYERKLIHMSLQDDIKVITYSEGEEPYRRVIIALKEE